MPDEFLGDRKKALEESFFAKENAKLIERLRAEQLQKSAREGLAAISGISDPAVLGELVKLGIGPETWLALSLAPLVEVAWADGDVEPAERRAVLAAAEANGVVPGSPSHALLEGWLARRHDARLLQAWGEYIVEVCSRLPTSEREALKRQVVGRARAVAETTGGILGLHLSVGPRHLDERDQRHREPGLRPDPKLHERIEHRGVADAGDLGKPLPGARLPALRAEPLNELRILLGEEGLLEGLLAIAEELLGHAGASYSRIISAR